MANPPVSPTVAGGPLEASYYEFEWLSSRAQGGFLAASPGEVIRIDEHGWIDFVMQQGRELDPSGDGGPAVHARIGNLNGLAAHPDGGFVFIDKGQLRRVFPSGLIDTIAGALRPDYSGDGGPAVLAGLDYPSAVAVGRDGRIFVAGGGRLRMISTDGTISTVAGSGVRRSGNAPPADGARALSVAFDDYLSGIRVMASGEPLIEVEGRIWRIDSDGLLHTVVGGGRRQPRLGEPASDSRPDVCGFDATADGGLLYSNEREIAHVGSDGRYRAVYRFSGRESYFDGDGLQARAVAAEPCHIAAAPDGGILFTDHDRRIRYLAAAAQPRLAVAIRRATVVQPNAVHARYALTAAATISATVRRRGVTLARRRVAALAGRGDLRLRAPLRPGVVYTLRLVARDGGRVATDIHRFLAGDRLLMSRIRRWAKADQYYDEGTYTFLTGCGRVFPRRIDCRFGYGEEGANAFQRPYEHVLMYILHRNGLVAQRSAPCKSRSCRPTPSRWSILAGP